MKNQDLEKFLFLSETKKETDFTFEVNPFKRANYERGKESYAIFDYQEKCNNYINNGFDVFSSERIILNNNNFFELNEEENDDDILNSEYHIKRPKEKKKKIFVAKKEKKQPQKRIKRGRKRKRESEKGIHSKNDDDNIIRKIKAHFFKYVNKTLRKTIKSTWHKFENIPYNIIKKSSNEYNIHLMNSTIKEIYEESIQHIDKYKRKDYERNKRTLEYLSKEENAEKEEKVINLLNLNFIQFFDNFRNENLRTFLDEINPLSKNNKSSINSNNESSIEENLDEKDVNKYLAKVEGICTNFETLLLNKFYSSKKGKKRIKTKKRKN